MEDLMWKVNNVVETLESYQSGDLKDGETLSLYDYFDDILDVEFRVGADKEYRSVKVAVALGGPSIYIDTGVGLVKGYWGTERYEASIPSGLCEDINEIFGDLWDC